MLDFSLNDANHDLRTGKLERAIERFDILASKSPRNFWLRVNAIWANLKLGRVREAGRRLGQIDCATQLGQSVTLFQEFVRSRREGAAENLWLDTPTDYFQKNSEAITANLRKISLGKKFPSGFPFDLQLPPVVGNENNYSFVLDSANRTPSRQSARQKILVVIAAQSNHELSAALEVLGVQNFPYADISLLVIKSEAVDARLDLGERAKCITWGNADVCSINQLILSSDADILLFWPAIADKHRWILSNIAKIHRITAMAVHVFPSIAKHPDISDLASSFNVCAEVDWRNEKYGFRLIAGGNFALPMNLFKAVGGLRYEIRNFRTLCVELGYRLYLQGAYFLPAPARMERAGNVSNEGDANVGLEEYCAAHWWRKHDGSYHTPKVSIYIPSYNNCKYIVNAIRSVLDQDYDDLEICICDDGSVDNTAETLSAVFASENRVRVLGGPNGGIGYASNRAVSMTRGLYVGQLDSDDMLKPGAVRRLSQYLDENSTVGCVYSSCERIGSAGEYIRQEYSFPKFSREKMCQTSIAHHFRMFRRQSWMRTEGFREDIVNAVDYDMFLKLSEVCQFHHLEEVLYQRRWHGANTSLVNEAAQSRNTSVVLNKALKRMGLDMRWEARSIDPDQPRRITYVRRPGVTRVFFWPDYSRANPYQRLVYASLDESFDVLSGDIKCALKSRQDDRVGRVVFHLHWINSLFDGDHSEAAKNVLEFENDLEAFSSLGGEVIWTVHNASSHDGRHVDLERELSNRLCKVANRVHVHSQKSLSELPFSVPREKIVVVPHGSYFGYYPNSVGRDEARETLGLDMHDFVILFTGQVRKYKGLELLLQAFSALAKRLTNWKLLVVGKALYDFDGEISQHVHNEVLSRVIFHNGFVEDDFLQVVYNAADVAAFPYQKILTTGSGLLSMSFGTPPILPHVGMVEELIVAGEEGFLYRQDTNSGLSEALEQAYAAKLDGSLAHIGAKAQAKARKLQWMTFRRLFEALDGDETAALNGEGSA